MQQKQADAINRKIAFLDPVAICESRHKKMCSTPKEKNDKRKKEHKIMIRTISAYISLQMQRWQDRDVIWAPYYLQ